MATAYKIEGKQFRKGERRKVGHWRSLTIVTGNITRAGVLVVFDPDQTDGAEGSRQFVDADWLASGQVL